MVSRTTFEWALRAAMGWGLLASLAAAQAPLLHETKRVTPPAADAQKAAREQHPLWPAVKWARATLPTVEALNDYTARLVMCERVDGELGEEEQALLKVRHRPFSVYLKFLSPARVQGQEVVYVAGLNDGRMLVRRPHGRAFVPVLPGSPVAMQGRNHALTEVGLVNLGRRLIEVGNEDIRRDECQVRYFNKATINGRSCTCIEVQHPTPRPYFRFARARIFVDDEYGLPVRYESHTWPSPNDGGQQLLEKFTYLDVRLNVGLTDADFPLPATEAQ